MTVRQRVDEALEQVKTGLNPFVATQMNNVYRGGWIERAKTSLRPGDTFTTDRQGRPQLDVTALCAIVLGNWMDVFGRTLGKREQSILHSVRSIRNAHFHQEEFDLERGLTALTEIEALLNAVGAGAQAERVRALKEETGKERYAAPARERAKSSGDSSGGTGRAPQDMTLAVDVADATLVPWRQVIAPHPDVASRRFINAEFAADLYQVAHGSASEEYRDPEAFFARTYLTSGLRSLLQTAATRLSGRGGDPVVELQTSFGGGKTHALLALYHIASGIAPERLTGVKDVLASTGIERLPAVRRAVVVGTKLTAGQVIEKPDGTIVRTLWGEIAHQLGGREGYALVAGADETGTSPGAALDTLLQRYAPCLILIDEWVAYARQLGEGTALVGGTFETQFSFAQALTEAVSAAPGAMLVVSLPVTEDRREALDIEVGGAQGRAALDRLRNVIARKQANWQPADASESFAIVRRRLFEVMDAEREKRRDAVVAKLHRAYKDKAAAFPAYASEPAYLQRLRDCYPIHPLLFEKLYNEWGAIEGFQRTRGVLRLMAAVVHVLWEREDAHPLIMPALLPLDDGAIEGDLVRYLGESWRSVLNRDVVGTDALAARIDRQSPGFGRAKAAQRAARAIFFATAPQNAEVRPGAPTLGIEAKEIRLACAFPGDNVNAFDDATRRLADDATHINTDGSRYWFAIAPNLNRRAQDLAAGFERYEVLAEVERLLLGWQRERGAFARVHLAKRDTSEVPDEPETRLVLLGPEHVHIARRAESPAKAFALDMALHAGEGDRRFRNALVFLAADQSRLESLEDSVRRMLAWRKIVAERAGYELTTTQIQTAEEKQRSAQADVAAALRACWCHGLVPTQQPRAGATIELDEMRIDVGDSSVRALEARLIREGALAQTLGPVNLRRELDGKNLWRGEPHVRIGTLYEDFARYPYLRRLLSPEVLRAGIAAGVGSLLTWETETFAYAEGFEAESGRYVGLRAGEQLAPEQVDLRDGLLVTSAAARAQLDKQAGATYPAADGQTGGPRRPGPGDGHAGAPLGDLFGAAPAATPVRSLFLNVQLDDPTRLQRVASQLANDIIAQLHAAGGSRVNVRVEVSGEFDAGLSPEILSVVTRNAAAHGFTELETR